jgi:hypothetical protein
VFSPGGTKGGTSPLGDKFYPWGSRFAPRGEVKNGPQSSSDTVFRRLPADVAGGQEDRILRIRRKSVGRKDPRIRWPIRQGSWKQGGISKFISKNLTSTPNTYKGWFKRQSVCCKNVFVFYNTVTNFVTKYLYFLKYKQLQNWYYFISENHTILSIFNRYLDTRLATKICHFIFLLITISEETLTLKLPTQFYTQNIFGPCTNIPIFTSNLGAHLQVIF